MKNTEKEWIKYNQKHLESQLDQLEGDQKSHLLEQMTSIDYKELDYIYKKLIKTSENEKKSVIKPIKAKTLSGDYRAQCRKQGEDLIKNGKLAVLLLAGGQGSRLGHEGPKGTFEIGLETGESLFELHTKQLQSVVEQTHKAIHFYIMTSDINHEDTLSFFEDKDYFGYDKKYIHFFKQSMLPAVNFEGKIILKESDSISFSPNGNGGMFSSMEDSGVIKMLLDEGVEWLYVTGVDNSLAKLGEAEFLGFADLEGFNASSKVVPKEYPEEKVGIICEKNGKPTIVEYSELSSEQNNEVDDNGDLLYSNSNILNHLFKVELITDFLLEETQYHLATKYIDSIYNSDENKEDRQANGYKFESFLFDIFPYSNGMSVLQVERHNEFAPVKNREGNDSPKTAKELVEAWRIRNEASL